MVVVLETGSSRGRPAECIVVSGRLEGFKVENSILLQSLLRHLSDDLGTTLSRMKHAALGPKKTSSSQETLILKAES